MDKETAEKILCAAILEEKLSTYSFLMIIKNYSSERLSDTGHKSKEAAFIWALEKSDKKIEGMIVKFEKQFPE